jgi:hypothetical protein
VTHPVLSYLSHCPTTLRDLRKRGGIPRTALSHLSHPDAEVTR